MTQDSDPAEDTAAAAFDPLSLDLQLCFALYSASHLMTRLYRPYLEPLGLTYLQYLALLTLWEKRPQSVGELGRRLNLDSSTLTPLFKRLEAQGLVTRKRDKADERRRMIDLTEAGVAMRERVLDVPACVFRQLPLPFDRLVTLKGQLGELIDGLREREEG
jgi:DNA-binding MarR family transcriptional regulator